ncbi:MAG: cobalamin-dependent protein [Deltaproteobacteria bacterium]|nr:cobalamin-dependent protein [Deltaproteobacteria bacterium]
MAGILLFKAAHITADNFSVVPPMGLMYLASVLREKGHRVRIVDTRIWRRHEEITSEVREFKPDLVGISAISFEARSLAGIAGCVKGVSEKIPVICGGAHPSSAHEECLAEKNIDYAVIGEGEETLPELISAIDSGKGIEKVQGVAFRNCDGNVFTGYRKPPENLDAMPFPAWDLIDIGGYASRKSMSTIGNRRYLTVITSRGCPYGCLYCHNIHGKLHRTRSPESVLEEMGFLIREFGIREFEILDDVFNLNRKRTAEILDGIAVRFKGVKLCFPNGLRGDLLDGHMIKLLKKAGAHYLSIAVETTSERLQKLIGKNLNIEKTRAAIEGCVSEGIYTNGFFMIGFPTETPEEMEQTVRFAVESPLHQAMFFRVIPFKGTGLAGMAGDRVRPDDWSKHDYFTSSLNISGAGDAEIKKIIADAYRRFYVNPRRLARLVLKHPNRVDLAKLGLLTMRRMFSLRRASNA